MTNEPGSEGWGGERRRNDLQIHAVQTDIHWLKEAVSRLESSIHEAGNRQPLLPLMALLIAGFGVTITLGVQALHGQNNLFEAGLRRLTDVLDDHQELGVRHKSEFREHIKDGHSEAVRDELGRVELELSRRIESVDNLHTGENVEQEDDIGELRAINTLVEHRLDTYLARISVLETQAVEIPRFFQLQIDEHNVARGFERKNILEKIRDTRQLIVGRKGGGFHQENWKLQALPRLEGLERRLETIENGK